jgi:hypothetical protein
MARGGVNGTVPLTGFDRQDRFLFIYRTFYLNVFSVNTVPSAINPDSELLYMHIDIKHIILMGARFSRRGNELVLLCIFRLMVILISINIH